MGRKSRPSCDRHTATIKQQRHTMVRLPTFLVAALAVLALHSPVQAAEDYPSKPITIVVSLAAGTGMDVVTRPYAEKLSQALGKPVIVENQPGAATTLAANQVANAPADGHTLVVLTSIALSINPTLYKHLNYDPRTSCRSRSMSNHHSFCLPIPDCRRSPSRNSFSWPRLASRR